MRAGERSSQVALDLALRRSVASKVKGAMIDGIAALEDLPTGLDAPVASPRTTTSTASRP